MDSGVAPILALLEQALQVNRDDLAEAEPGPDAAFRLLRESAERAGVFVLLMGDLGNYHSAISVETFRGFAIADPVAPFIAINDRDSHAAWSFTLLHELVHLCLANRCQRPARRRGRGTVLQPRSRRIPVAGRRTARGRGGPGRRTRLLPAQSSSWNALLDLVARTVRTQSLSASKAGFVLGVNIKQVQPLLDLRTFGGSGRAA